MDQGQLTGSCIGIKDQGKGGGGHTVSVVNGIKLKIKQSCRAQSWPTFRSWDLDLETFNVALNTNI